MTDTKSDFSFKRNDNLHILSDRSAVNWKEVFILPLTSFLVLIFTTGWIIAVVVSILFFVGYLLFRFASWVFYRELVIDEDKRKLFLVKKLLNKSNSTLLISDKFDPSKIQFIEQTRSGRTKYSMQYQTYKVFDLFILQNQSEKDHIKRYIENISTNKPLT